MIEKVKKTFKKSNSRWIAENCEKVKLGSNGTEHSTR